MADDTNPVTDDTATTADSAAQPGTTLLTMEIDDKGDTPAASDGTTPANPDQPGDKTDPDNPDAAKGEGKKDDDKPQGPPEKYEITLPDGEAVDQAALQKFEPLLRKHGLSNEAASELATAMAEQQKEFPKQLDTAFREQLATWGTEVKQDKEIGGAHFVQNMKAAQRTLTVYGTKELRAALDSTGMGQHPELVRLFARVGKTLSEDTIEKATMPTGAQKTAAEKLYGKP